MTVETDVVVASRGFKITLQTDKATGECVSRVVRGKITVTTEQETTLLVIVRVVSRVTEYENLVVGEKQKR